MSIQVNSKIQSSPCGPRVVEQNTTEIRTLALTLREIPADAFPSIRGSIVASIPACHAGDPGSIPGRGDSLSLGFTQQLTQRLQCLSKSTQRLSHCVLVRI